VKKKKSIRYIEILYKKYTKVKFKGSSKEYFPGEGFVSLISYINDPKVEPSKFQQRIRTLYPKIRDTTVFFKVHSHRLYFPYILPLAGIIDKNFKIDISEDDPPYSMMCLNLLSYSLIRDPEEISKLFLKLYKHNIIPINNLFLYLSINWKRLTANSTDERRNVLIKELNKLSEQIIEENTKLYADKSTEKSILNQIEVSTAGCVHLQKSLRNSLGKEEVEKQKGSSLKWILLLLVLLGIIYLLYIYQIIPKEYANEAIKYIPERVFEELEKTRRQLGL